MRIGLLFSALLILAGRVTAASLSSVDGVILSADKSKALLNQCSRGTPQHVTGIWTPADVQIRELERRLPAALALKAQEHGPRYTQTTTFRRQYAGLIVGNRRVIYVNAFPLDVGNPAKDGTPAARAFDWHREPVIVCDGGPAFFGLEYDPQQRTFSNFEFNGPP
jgi:hypothetical protein